MTAPPSPSPWTRTLLGIFACLMIVFGTAGWWADRWPVFYNSLLRAGILLLGVWLAFPQLTSGRWKATAGLIVAVLLVVALLASRPRLLPVLGALMIAVALLQTIVAKWLRPQTPQRP